METTNFIKNASKHGLFIAVIMILITLIYYILNINVFNWGFMAFSLVLTLSVTVGVFIIGIKSYRTKVLEGKITFGQAFLQGLLIGAVAYIIIAVFNYIFYAFIAPDYANTQLNAFIEFMEGMNVPEDALDVAIADFEEKMNPFGQFTSALSSGSIMTILVSLITAASIKKDATETQIV